MYRKQRSVAPMGHWVVSPIRRIQFPGHIFSTPTGHLKVPMSHCVTSYGIDLFDTTYAHAFYFVVAYVLCTFLLRRRLHASIVLFPPLSGEVGHIAYVASCSFGIYGRCDSVLLLFREDLANRIRGELSLPCASFLGVVTAHGSCRLSYLVVSLVL